MSDRKDIPKKNALRAVSPRSVSPLQRYRMIAEMAYYRALERGFLSGNPVEDWLEAEKAVDAKHPLDLSKLLVTPHIAELFELLNRLLKIYGLPPIDIRSLVEKERMNVQALAEANARVGEPIKTAVSRQIEILKDALETMLSHVDLLAQSGGPRGMLAAEQGKLLQSLGERTLANVRESMEATVQASVESLDQLKARVVETFGVLQNLAEGFAEQSQLPAEGTSPQSAGLLNVKEALAPAYADMSFREILNAPIFALQGLSEGDAEVLRDTFGIRTLKDFAKNRHFNWAHEIFAMSEAEGR